MSALLKRVLFAFCQVFTMLSNEWVADRDCSLNPGVVGGTLHILGVSTQ